MGEATSSRTATATASTAPASQQDVRVGDRDQQRRRPAQRVVAAHHSSPARSSSERIFNRSRSATCSAITACAHAGSRHSHACGLPLDPRPLPGSQLADPLGRIGRGYAEAINGFVAEREIPVVRFV
jgi:hypothetical protein